MNKKVLEQLEIIYQSFLNLEKELEILDINNNLERYKMLNKEKARIEPIMLQFLNFKKIEANIAELKAWLETENSNDETAESLKLEIKNSEAELSDVFLQLQLDLVPKDENDSKNVIFEIRGAAGGEEANLFAADLYRMYTKYAETKNWKIELIEAKETANGGFANLSFLLKGKQVFAHLKFEAGAHRVQRIPKTESQGRIHTSVATVAILPELNDIEVKINNSDLKIDTYRASGAGGQHVNTTDSAVRITHLPTNIIVTSQDGRSQHDNKEKAMKVLRAKLYEKQAEEQQGKIGNLRKSAVGTGDRSEKIRTYNYPQNRVTDHRIGLTLQKLNFIMEGDLDEIINALIAAEQQEKLENIEAYLTN